MIDDDKRAFADLMDATMPVYRMEASTATKRLWWNLLSPYAIEDVAQGFAEHLRKNANTITPADIIKQIERIRPDGRPGVEEAWSMIPRTEEASAVLTDEMMEAMRFAQPLLDEGDHIAARMAFKEAYTTIVDSNRRNGILPRWFPSLGSDKEGRDACLSEAIRLGRLSAEHAVGLLPPDKVAPMLEAAGEEKLALEHKVLSNEEMQKRIAQLREKMGWK